MLTLPAAAAIGALTFGITRIFGTGAFGPVLVSVAIVIGMVWVFTRRLQRGPAVTAAEG
jgi:PiT family inorganic phosphate transporter